MADDVARGERALLVADDAAGIVGTVQLVLAQPENQPHRADLAKMLVHRRARRAGPGRGAAGRGRTHGAATAARPCWCWTPASAEAERLYARAGWQRCGTVPGYALLPHGGLCATTFFYRELG